MRISWARPDATAPRSANRFLVPVAGTRRFYNNFRRFRDRDRCSAGTVSRGPRLAGASASATLATFARSLPVPLATTGNSLHRPLRGTPRIASGPTDPWRPALLRLLRRNAAGLPLNPRSSPGDWTVPEIQLYSTVRRGAVRVTVGLSSSPINPKSVREKSTWNRTWKSDSRSRCASRMSGVTSIAM